MQKSPVPNGGKRVIVALFLFFQCFIQAEPVTVNTPTGPIRGNAKNGILEFRGIPYAQAPIGMLRWKKPQPITPWTEILDASKSATTCPQLEFSGVEVDTSNMSEDCLFLNIWTPEGQGEEKLPVFVWIHGGGFYLGSSSEPVYNGAALASKGLVVVTINYRLGVFGFLADSLLTAESGTSGNYGIMDQIEALSWIRKSISRFGGDPNQITIAGQSAGAASIGALLIIPEADSLYDKAIMMSGIPALRLRLLNEEQINLPSAHFIGKTFKEISGISGLSELRDSPILQLVESWDSTLKKVSSTGGVGDGTLNHLIIDGKLLTKAPGQAVQEQNFHKVPTIIGNVEDEGYGFTITSGVNTVLEYRDFIINRFGFRAGKIFSLYPVYSRQQIFDQLLKLNSHLLICSAGEAAKSLSFSTKVYRYNISYAPHWSQTVIPVAFHGSELPQLFGTPPEKNEAYEDSLFLEVLSDAFVDFIHSDTPLVGPYQIPWQPFTQDQEAYMDLSLTPKSENHFISEACSELVANPVTSTKIPQAFTEQLPKKGLQVYEINGRFK